VSDQDAEERRIAWGIGLHILFGWPLDLILSMKNPQVKIRVSEGGVPFAILVDEPKLTEVQSVRSG
jgi:hypothetical protein